MTYIVSVATSSIQSPPDIKDFKFKSSVSDIEKLLEEKFRNLNLNTLNEEFEELEKINNHSEEEINKIKWADIPKFIDGLPFLFAERVRKVLRNDDINISYDNYTYGNLINTCIQEGLALCNELKLNNKIKRQNLLEKKQLGKFCDQFGMELSNKGKRKIKDKDEKIYKKRHLSESLERAEFVLGWNVWLFAGVVRIVNCEGPKILTLKICGKFKIFFLKELKRSHS